MFDKLIDFLLSIVIEFKFWYFVKHYEGAVVLRNGNIHRHRYTGLYLRIPFFEHIDTHYIKDDSILFPTQTLTTLDGHTVTVSGMVLYYIDDIVPFLTELNEPVQAISDIGLAVIANHILSNNLKDIRGESITEKIAEDISEKCKEYGITIKEFNFTGIANSRSLNISKQIESHL